MKYIKAFTVIIFALIIAVPVATFNFKPNVSSEIDNRMLFDNPFSQENADSDNILKDIENYVNDRIGLRDKMILCYTVLNDKLFGKMVHPSYTYGKDKYVFGNGITTKEKEFSEYHEVFIKTLKRMQNYCDDRDIPFIFVFNPAKPAVYSEYIQDGIEYDREWVDKFFAELDKENIRYIDNTKVLKEKKEQGEAVFNKQYDANHWNDLGAFYGTNAILEEVQKDFPTVRQNDINDFTVTETLQTTLPVSKFPIRETVENINVDLEHLTVKTDMFKDELKIDPDYQTFDYYSNEEKASEGAPKCLVFQGSYMNGFGYKYLANAFGEYIYIHDYQNVIDLPYYCGVFKPDCVIFEVAEYTVAHTYFNYDKMYYSTFNPPLKDMVNSGKETVEHAFTDMPTVSKGNALTQIHWKTDTSFKNVWLSLGEDEYDMIKVDDGYVATLQNEYYNSDKELKITAYDEAKLNVWK